MKIIEKQCLHVPNVGNIYLYILQENKIINVNTCSCMRIKGWSRFLLHVDSKIASSFAMKYVQFKNLISEQSKINIKKSIE